MHGAHPCSSSTATSNLQITSAGFEWWRIQQADLSFDVDFVRWATKTSWLTSRFPVVSSGDTTAGAVCIHRKGVLVEVQIVVVVFSTACAARS